MKKGDKSFWAATFTLSGTIIGAGILGLPYVFSKAGFLAGLFWLIFLGLVILIVNLYMGEVVLRTNGFHQLTGYSEKYLGVWGKRLMLFAMIFGIYSALVAYLVGEGQSISYSILGANSYTLAFGFLFWLLMTLLLREGLKGLKRVETWGVLAIIIFTIGLFVWFFPSVQYSNIFSFNPSMFFLPLGIVLFSLLGFSSIPEVAKELEYSKTKLMKAIIIGSLIPIVLYIGFCFAFVGVFGSSVKEVATLSAGRIASLLGIFTMMTGYFVLSFVLRDMFVRDLKIRNNYRFILVSLAPLLLYFIISFFNLLNFSKILGIGGVISGGLTGVLIVLMNYRAKKYGDRRPEYWIPINWLVVALISILFIAAIIIELVV